MLKSFMFVLLSLLFTGCAAQTALVYERKGDRQCAEGPGKTLSESTGVLTGSGIEVLESQCGTLSGVVMAMCGAPTLNILLHTIEQDDLGRAEKLGFKQLSTLAVDAQDAGFSLVPCKR